MKGMVLFLAGIVAVMACFGVFMAVGLMSLQDAKGNVISTGSGGLAVLLLSIILALILGFFLSFKTPQELYLEQAKTIDGLKEQVKPKLQIEFSEEAIQTDISDNGRITFYRVLIKNTGNEGITDLRVKITGENLRQILPFVPAKLIATNEASGKPHLNANDEILIEVIYVIELKNAPIDSHYIFKFGFEEGLLNSRPEMLKLELSGLIFDVEATGMNTAKVTKTFTFDDTKRNAKNIDGFGETNSDRETT